MKIVAISDTHGQHKSIDIPEGDILIHAGDISSRGHKKQVKQFIDWFTGLPHKHKVFIGGNHDFLLEYHPEIFKELLNEQIIYLEDDSIEIEGIKLWGSPITPWFYDWAFNRSRGEKIRKYWELIPDDIDIIITHGPPAGIGDRTARGDSAGCQDLLEIIQKIQPRYHIFGHIHEAYGMYERGETTYVNASCLNLAYQPVNAPVVFEWK